MDFQLLLKAGILMILSVLVTQPLLSAESTVDSKADSDSRDIILFSPREYQVFQRKALYDGYISISGRVKRGLDRLQLRVTGKSLKGNLPGKWKDLQFDKYTGGFVSCIPVIPGGWYKVEVRTVRAGKVIAETQVERVGVGEVFVGAGQSNSTNYGEQKDTTSTGMVSSFDGSKWQLANDPQLGTHDASTGGSIWPAFGDVMYEKYHVPIGVAVTGHGGTSVAQWQPSANDGLFDWMMTRIYQLGPQGFRAVLWHQGESDVLENTSSEAYYERLSNVIDTSKRLSGWDFPWFVAQVSYINPELTHSETVRSAQKRIWDTWVALEGPDTDLLGGDNRDGDGKGIHFSLKGLKVHGKVWAETVGAYLDLVLKGK